MDDFDRFWSLYPKRVGSNPKTVARQKFDVAVKSGVSAELIIAGLKAWIGDLEQSKQIGTKFVPMARTWLYQRQWEGYEPEQIEIHNLPTKVFVPVDSPAWAAWSKLRRWPQSDFKIDGRYQRGWHFNSEWPEGEHGNSGATSRVALQDSVEQT